MKHGTMKRMASILLVLVMLMSFIPTAAFATGATDTTAEPTATAEPTQAPEQTEASTSTPTSTPTEAPTETATPTQTPEQTEAPAATAEPTPTPEQTAEPTTTPTSSPEPTAEPTITYTVSITLPVEGVNLADGQDTSLQTVTTVTLEDGKRTLTQAVTAGSAMAEIRLVSSYEDEPFDERYAVAFNERLFKDTGLTASCDENGVITISGTPAADVTVDLESAFADEPTTADASAVYVSSSGDDTNGDGSQTAPYATIANAYSNVANGGTIYLLTDVDVSSQIAINIKKTVTITSANAIKTIYSKYATNTEGNALIVVSNSAEVIFTNITLDGSGQKYTDGKYYSPCCVYVNAGTATLETGTTISGFQKDDSTRSGGGASVLKVTAGGATINIRDGALITNCTLSHGKADDTTSVVSAGTGGKVYMTGGMITGNMLSTTEDGTTAVVNIGKYLQPHFWMTGGMITGNTINRGLAAVYMRGENSECDIRFGNTAYVYDNCVNGTSGDQRNVYLKNKNTSNEENSSVYAKLCSALTTGAKLGIYADIISMSTKVAQGDDTYTATAADTTYFVSDKATDAEILYCGGDETTCGLLEHRSGTTHEKAIYLSVSPEVTAAKNETNNDQIDLSIVRCDRTATYVVLDKDMKPVTDRTLSGGTYGTNGTFTLTNANTTAIIGMPGLSKDSGPYTVMLVGDGGLSVTDGKANTSNLTDIATVNIVNFADEGVQWSAGETTFENGEFDIVTVPHNDQTGKATKSYTATPKANYKFDESDAITGKLDDGAETETTANVTANKVENEEKYNVSVTVPAYGTTEKGTSGYNTVTLKGSTVLSTGVKLLTTTGGTEMTVTEGVASKVYDGAAVAYTDVNLDGVTLSYTWQKKNADGTYTNIEGNTPPSDAGEYNLLVTATSSSDSSKVLSTENLPFIISKRPLTVTATANDKTYDGKMDAELKSAALEGVLEADATAVTLDSSKITVTFADKNAGDSKTVTATAATDALTGDKAGNYVITSATANDAKISPKTITATIKANDKEYDGSASATVSTPTLVSVVENDDVTATASNAVFVGGAGVDNKKTVTADIALSGNDVGNYTLSKTTASDTANITAKELSVTVNADNKQYDGTTDAKATVTLTDTDIIAGETVTLDDSNMKAMFEDADVGSDKTVTVTGLKLSGDSAKNYKLPTSITGTANITQATSGVGTVTLTGWTYGDAANTPTASSTTNPGTATYQYRAKDAAGSDPWLDDAPADAGEYTVKATFPANDNYGETTATANFTIAKKTLTATITAKNKEYDGTNAAEVTKVELTGMVNGESVTATASDAHFAGVNARNDQTVTATITLDNSDAAKNYTVASTATTTASITAKTLTVTATAVSKTYDGTTKAEISNVELTGAVGGDTVELNQSSMTAAFENATVGEGKKVTVSGLALDNNDNGNYKLPNTITTTANITQAAGSGTVTLDGWTYGDAAKTPTASSTTNPETETSKITYQYKLKDADDNTYTNTVPTDAGEYTVKATFPANGNYTEATATADFTIAKKALTVNVTAKNKTYDGTENVELENETLVGVEEADKDKVTLVTNGVTAAFSNKNAGTDKPVTLTGEYTLTGDAAKNYTVTMPTNLKATITPATLTITGATVKNKTYDGDDDATVTGVTFDGVQTGDTLTPNVDYTVYNAKYDGVNATGEGAATKATFNVVLTNTDAAKNYTLTTTAGTQEATITKASRDNSTLTTEGNRGEENTLSNLSGYVVAGGAVGTITTSGAEIFEETPTYDRTSGTLTYKLKSDATENMTATVTLPVTSANYNDYNINVNVDVTPKETVEIGITEENYVYDGTPHAPTGITVAGNKVLVSALEVTYEGAEGTTYEKSTTAPTNAGKYIMTVKVPDSNTKYSGTKTLTFEIAKKPLTATITAENKTYDGTTTATVTPTLTGVVAGDSGKVTTTVANPAFEDKNAGENKKVTASITLTGDAAGNYTVNAEAATTASISVKEVSITDVTVADSKTYDKTTAAEITNNGAIDGKADTDDLRITAGTASYDNANAGTGKTVSFTGFELTGEDAANYRLTGQPASVKADITAKKVTISGVTIDATKVYDGNADAKITDIGTLTGVLDSDTVTIQTGTATYNDKNVGDNKTVTFSGFALEGADAANYTLTAQPDATSAAITQREVTISGLSATKTYDGDDTAEKSEITGTAVIDNKVSDDYVSVNTDSMMGKFDSADAGENKTVTISGISLTGTDAANYKLPETVTCAGKITQATGEGSVTLDGWTYGETAKTPTVTSTTNGTDSVTYRYKLKSADDSPYTTDMPTNAGEYTVEATFPATNNYNAVVVTNDFTIAKKTLSMTATAQDKTYDGSATATVDATLNADGILSGDVVTLDTTGVTASFDSKDAGTDKSVTLTGNYTLTGAAADNYTLTQPTGLTATINKKALTIKDLKIAPKTYDGTNTASFDGTPTLDGVVEGETVTLVNGTPTFSTVQVGENVLISFTEFTLDGTGAGNYTVEQPTGITANIDAYNANGTEYTTTTPEWTDQDFVVTATSGWKLSETNTAEGTWSDTLTRSAETGNTNGSLTFYVKNTTTGVISEVITEDYRIDKTAPTGEISIVDRTSWQEFVNTITFNLFYKDTQYVKLTANDAGSGVKTIEYLTTAENLTVEQLAGETFTPYTVDFGIDPDAKLIVYAKLTDNAGNVTYLRSDGVVLDATAPVINGAENGKTYCSAVTLTITDDYLDTVTVNGVTATLTDKGELTLNPATGTQTVIATDKAGNSTSITVTVNDGCTWGAWTSNGNNTHTRTCQYDAAHTETGDCAGGTATCSAAAVCTTCGGAHGEKDPSNHSNLTHVPYKAATVYSAGNIEYWYCSGCGKYYLDANATNAIAQSYTVIPRLSGGWGVRTGDDSDLTLWLTLLLLSGSGSGAALVLGKRKKYGE